MSRGSLCGIDLSFCSDLIASLEEAEQWGYSFACAPLFHPRYRRHARWLERQQRPETVPDAVLFESGDWSRFLVGKASPWLRCDDPSVAERQRRNSVARLADEMSWAQHLGLTVFMVALHSGRNANLARVAVEFLKAEKASFRLWVRVPMRPPRPDGASVEKEQEEEEEEEEKEKKEKEEEEEEDNKDTWLWWHRLCRMCDAVLDSVSVALEMTPDLPEEDQLRRWMAEPVKAIFVPTSCFVANRKGYPVLPKAHQDVLRQFFRLRLQVVVTGSPRHGKGPEFYQQYIRWLYKHQPDTDPYTTHGQEYEDYLQEPLQPLMDNLHSGTYQVFEMDPYKYRAYREAVRLALLKIVPEEEKETREVTVAVLGAGRGPLVQECLTAGEQSGRRLRQVVAVEKNRNAVVTLRNRALAEWRGRVTVLQGDMRSLPTDFVADIFVSELLGSFGDNELSPECLYAAEHRLAPGGINIPQWYTSYMAPLHSTSVYREVTRQRDPEKPPHVFLETPYVVNLVNCELLAPPAPVFTFTHPRDPAQAAADSDHNNCCSRYQRLEFVATQSGVMHALAGYFDSCLYDTVPMSILPSNHSPNMFSWFPIVFPLSQPVPISAGQRIVASVWRVATERRVWYEWTVEQPLVLPIHNPGGRSYTIGL